MQTIGYKESETFRKIEIAKAQLIDAIWLFTQEHFISSLTLAGAAEELFAGHLKTEGKKPIIEQSFDIIKKSREELRLPTMENKSKSEVIAEWNHSKNRFKHHDKNEAQFITLNDCDEAYWMIKRALENAKKLDVSIPNGIDFENWVIINICI